MAKVDEKKKVVQMSDEEQAKIVAEFVQKAEAKAKASIGKRASELRDQLQTRGSTFLLLLQKRQQLQAATDRLSEIRAERKRLQGEIKEIRTSMKAKKEGRVIDKTA